MAEKKEKDSGKKLFYDENLVIHLDEVPDPGFDMCYYQVTTKLIKYFEAEIRKSFEYKEWIGFMKHHLDINHCSFYEGYSMAEGFTIQIHHSPFTLYNIVEAVCARMMEHDQKVETFRVVEEVNKLHYQFRVGLTPLNPTAHELVHSGVLPIHPKIIIGDWKSFYSEYSAYLSEDAINKYNEAITLEEMDPSKLNLKILEYKPTTIQVPDFRHMISMDELDTLIVANRLAMVDSLSLPPSATAADASPKIPTAPSELSIPTEIPDQVLSEPSQEKGEPIE